MKERYQQTVDTWNKLAFQYQDLFMNLDIYNESYDLFCTAIKKHKAKILDVACGPGNITRYLLKKRANFDILGIDVASNMIQLAQANNPKAQFKIMNCSAIAQLLQTFDGIIVGFCLPYLSTDDLNSFIGDCKKTLNENGILYLSFVDGDPNLSALITTNDGDKLYFYYHKNEYVNNLLIEFDFKIIQIQKVTFQRTPEQEEIHTIIIAQK